jgi:endonuclease III
MKLRMKPKNQTERKTRVQVILRTLDRMYPGATCALIHRSPWELLVATILSAQCTDVRVNIVTKDLFRKYRTAGDYANVSQDEFAADIRSTGFYNNKAKSIRGAAAKIVADFGGKVPDTMDALLTLPGVARKTANVVLGNAFGKSEGVVVDTHVSRLAGRLRLSTAVQPEKIEQDLMTLVPREDWTLFAHLMIYHGRAVCTARKPDCAGCPVNKLCPSAFKV